MCINLTGGNSLRYYKRKNLYMKITTIFSIVCSLIILNTIASSRIAKAESADPNLVTESTNASQTTSSDNYLKKLDIASASADMQFSFLGLPKPLILPDSPFYPIITYYEKFRLLITVKPDSRTQLTFEFAERRLAEAYKLTEKGRGDLAKISLEKYHETLGLLSESLVQRDTQGDDVISMVRKVEANVIKEYRIKDFIAQTVDATKTDFLEHAQTISAQSLLRVLELAAAVKESTPSTEFQEKVKTTINSSQVQAELRRNIELIWQENFVPEESSESADLP